MNVKLLNTHISNVSVINRIPVLEMSDGNRDAFFCADVLGKKRFAQNFAGYPRSDIAQLNAAASEQEMNYLLSQLKDYSPSTNPNAGLSDTEIMLGHKSKYCQTPSETISWLESQLERRDLERQAQELKAAQEAKASESIKFEKEVDNV